MSGRAAISSAPSTHSCVLRFETAFYEPMLSDWRNFENWSESGAKNGTERANAIWKELLRTYEAPPLDAATSEELEAYVARRKEQIGTGKLNAA
jgi:trimethylamine---corrinoid protein Co-methyltransferase